MSNLGASLGSLYNWFWWHTEVWIADTKLRRPYTYVMRDHPWSVSVPMAILGTAAYFVNWYGRVPIILFAGMLLAHLWWGSRVDRWQQEDPEYNPIEGVHLEHVQL